METSCVKKKRKTEGLFWYGGGRVKSFVDSVRQGSPTPGPQTGTGQWPVRNWAAQQVRGGRASKQASFLCCSASLPLSPEPSLPPTPWKNCLP